MQCLNLKITYKCTNRCSFCFASHMGDVSITKSALLNTIRSGFMNGCRELVLSGGEPTLLPDTMIFLMQEAEKIGYEKYIIQTNGFGMSSGSALIHFLEDIAVIKPVCVSFSVHGHLAEIHDEMSSTKGAFDRLMKAMEEIALTHCHFYTNTVVSSLNYRCLADIYKMLLPFSPDVVQFAVMHVAVPNPLSIGLVETAKAVRRLKGVVPTNILRSEGIPYCLMHGLEKCVGESYWPNRLDLCNKDGDYMSDFKQLGSMRLKAGFCEKCVMSEICPGIWRETLEEFIHSRVRPIR